MRPLSYRTLVNAAAALSLLASASSCAEVEVDGYEGAESYIDFSPSVETKVLVEDAGEMDGFAVWAYYKEPGTGSYTEVFGKIGGTNNGVPVTRQNDGAWTYDGLRKWEFGVIYNFYALYPMDVSGVSLRQSEDGTDPHITIDGYQINSDGNRGDDLMMAVSEGISYSDGDRPSPVIMRFSHLLSRIDLVCRPYSDQDIEGYEPRVHSAKLYGLGTEASFSSDQFTAGNTRRNGWTVSGESLTTEDYPLAGADIPDGGLQISERTSLMSGVLVFPQQTFRPGMVFKIEWSATGDGNTTSSVIELITLPLEAWVGGKHYVYTFTILPEGRIIFDTPSVQKWDEAVGGIIIVE